MYSFCNDHAEAQPPRPAMPRSLESAIGTRLQSYLDERPLPPAIETLLDRLSAVEAAGRTSS